MTGSPGPDEANAATPHPAEAMAPTHGKRPYPAIVFVAQAGSLERMALLLAASIRQHAGDGPELIAATPAPADEWGGTLDPRTLALFERLNVHTQPIHNPFGRRYPIGNKYGCLSVHTTRPGLIFLDSDIFMMADLPRRILFQDPIEAVPETSAHLTLEEWRIAYNVFGLDLPETRMTELGSAVEMVPLYNGGFVATTRGDDLGRQWTEVSLALDRAHDFPQRHKEWGLDEWALPIAARLLGEEIRTLPMALNFPSWEFSLAGNDPVFFHYQRGRRILKQRRTFEAAAAVVAAYPEMREILAEDEELSMLRDRRFLAAKRARILGRKLLRIEERRHNRHLKGS